MNGLDVMDLVIAIGGLMVAGLTLLATALAFILKYVETVRSEGQRRTDQISAQLQTSLSKLEDDLRAADKGNRTDWQSAQLEITHRVDAQRRELADMITNTRLELTNTVRLQIKDTAPKQKR